jgi:hypothetical protein
MNLTEIRSSRILLLSAQMLRGWTRVSIAFDPDTGKEDGFVNCWF